MERFPFARSIARANDVRSIIPIHFPADCSYVPEETFDLRRSFRENRNFFLLPICQKKLDALIPKQYNND
jgi:hypothetical protein